MKPGKRRRVARWAIWGAIVAVLVIQFVPIDRTNPPAGGEPPFQDGVRAILHRSCYDCHSNRTVWPWYSRIAPVSWLISHDVHEGREHLNFSTWDSLGAEERVEAVGEIWEEVEGGDMPLWFYLPAHPEARLSDEDRTILKAWSQEVSGKDM